VSQKGASYTNAKQRRSSVAFYAALLI
jgi:hypothetical protein